MRRDIYKIHQNPKLITDLKVGDFVWGVVFSKYPYVAKYQVSNIRHSKDNKFFLYEVDLIEDYSIEGKYCRTYTGFWWEKNDFDITLSKYPKDAKIVCSKKYRGCRFFSDETVMKHSLKSHIWHLHKDEWGRLKKIKRHLDYLYNVTLR